MRRLSIPDPPNPSSPKFRGDLMAWQRAIYTWMGRFKGSMQDAHNDLSRPCGQQFLATSFTTNTVATGTTTGTDLSNVVASLVDTLTQGGVLSPSISRNQTQ